MGVVGEGERGAVPLEDLTGIFGGFHGEEAGLGAAEAGGEGAPEMGRVLAEGFVDPGVPVVEGFELGEAGPLHAVGLFAFAPDFEGAFGGEDEGAAFADDDGADAAWPVAFADAELGAVGAEVGVVEVEVAGRAGEAVAADLVGEGGEDAVGVEEGEVARGRAGADVGGALEFGEGVEEDVGGVDDPVGDLSAAETPPAPPLALDHLGAAGFFLDAVQPEVVVEAGGGRGGLAELAVGEVVAAGEGAVAEGDVDLDDLAEAAAFQDFDGGAAGRVLDALGAGLGDEVGIGGGGAGEDVELFELLDEGFLAVDVLALGEGEGHDRAVGVVGGGDDDGVELSGVFVEGFAVVGAGEGGGVVLGGLGEGVFVDIAEADHFDGGV